MSARLAKEQTGTTHVPRVAHLVGANAIARHHGGNGDFLLPADSPGAAGSHRQFRPDALIYQWMHSQLRNRGRTDKIRVVNTALTGSRTRQIMA